MKTIKVSTFYEDNVQIDKVDVYLDSSERDDRPTNVAQGSLSFESDTGMISAFSETDGWVDQFSIKS